MRNIIKDVAAKNAVPWGEIAEKIDENFSEVDANFVKGIKVNGSTITRKNENGVIDIGNTNDIYVIPDFTIEDLESLSNATTTELFINARALISALNEKKAIGILQKKVNNNAQPSMSIASTYRNMNNGHIFLTVISGDGLMYKADIKCLEIEDPEVKDSESGLIYGMLVQVTPIETNFVPFNIFDLEGVRHGFQSRVPKNIILSLIETDEPWFIKEGNKQGVIPVSYFVIKPDGNPTAIDIDVVRNNGLFHIHWDLTDDTATSLILNSETVSYTPFSDVYIVTEFTTRDIVAQAGNTNPTITVSRAFLDAMYRGIPIMVRTSNHEAATTPITVDTIENPTECSRFQFRIKHFNTEYVVICRELNTITGNKTLSVMVNAYNLADWNEGESSNTGYIANRTHHLGYNTLPINIGQRVSLAYTKGAHYIDNYRLLYDGKFYDLPTVSSGTVDIANYFRVILNGYSESGNTSTYTFTTSLLSTTPPSKTFEIYCDLEDRGYKALDEFYLPDGAKPWKSVIATSTEGGAYLFSDINNSAINNGGNLIRNKTIYTIGAGPVEITPYFSTSVIEFKIKASRNHTIGISGKFFWENGAKPDISKADAVIYSFLMLDGIIYASAKVYQYTK
jgi:hypothetical protein